ncbi:non-ribosomal peptide synthetase [Pedosphaera parvula]|uniref:Amino acid adenylation domain protein n=1 Tax=Pedosphaera parvula (strain Ellin514) TaxID=320771 RepID=B9XJE5_PEDPL|nr:non-ribosomal peptide synthetase [Pedosphaera parvula]EEF60006.1 amino acid adenylation domain protein [Pedosphaera parvula Ellin514]
MNNFASLTEGANQKLELLDFLLDEEGIGGNEQKSISRRANPDEYPLSFSQKRLWFLDQLEPGPHYNDHFHLRIQGPLNPAFLQKSLDEIVRRHEVLRASFVVQNGEPAQRIAPSLTVALPFVDLSAIPESLRMQEATRIAVEDGKVLFDLGNGPVFRAQLVRLDESDHLLLLTLHHIAIDGWSRGVFLKELTALYEAFNASQPSPLAPLAIQYADFAAWQQQFVQEEALVRQLAYWKQQLTGAPALLEWPTTFPRPAIQSFRGARKPIRIPKATSQGLATLGKQEGCTLFMTLLAAFQVLAGRYTGQEDIVVGSPIANRNRVEIEGLIGYFLNTLVLRTKLSGNPTFREVMSQVREVSLAAYANQDVPYEKLVEELHPARDQSHNPVFQVMFIFQNAPAPALRTKELVISPFEIDAGISKFDLTFNLEESPEGIFGWIEYATDLFDHAAIDRLIGHYQTLLTTAVREPNLPIAQLPILTPSEKQQLFTEWNDTLTDYPRNICIHQLFEAQAARNPHSMAVICGDSQLTYEQVNKRANQLARHLQSLGVCPGKLVAICVERSAEMVIGLLGILKAGGTYAPLDPALPRERLQFILQDAEASVVLTQSDLVPDLKELFGSGPMSPTPVLLDSNEGVATYSSENLQSSAAAGDVAYVIYTSGSTGKPKGVEISHRAVVNFLDSMSREPGLTETDTLLAVTTLSFDIAGLELWLPLTCGAKVVIATREVTLDGKQLASLLDHGGVTIMQATPTTWRLLLASGWKGNPGLRILCGGEAWSSELANQLHGKCASLWNMYGPTETTIWSAASKVEPGDEVFIGAPIANTQFYVLDRNLQPVPIGVPGELWIGGEGLARGYLKRPELSLEKFLPNPFTDESGARMYRTGDLVRYRMDGKIEFLGRMDYQVKIRGFRIELGEIELLLTQLPTVVHAVVIAREDTPGDKRLVAYVVSRDSAASNSSELRDYLKSKLPDYMVPSAFVFLPALPLTPNGKIDRQALPAPEQNRPEATSIFLAPRTQVEETIAAIWTKVLRLEKVGVNDSFFDLGGHSLLMVQVHARLCEELKINISIVRLFQYPTIGSLARYLSQAATESKPLQKDQDRVRLQKESFARRRPANRK